MSLKLSSSVPPKSHVTQSKAAPEDRSNTTHPNRRFSIGKTLSWIANAFRSMLPSNSSRAEQSVIIEAEQTDLTAPTTPGNKMETTKIVDQAAQETSHLTDHAGVNGSDQMAPLDAEPLDTLAGVKGSDLKAAFDADTVIEKHTASTLSQLDVAITNFKLAGTQCNINDIDTIAANLKTKLTAEIKSTYAESGKDVGKIDKKFRSKTDDFGLTHQLTVLLDQRSYGTGHSYASQFKASMVNLVTKGEIPGHSYTPGLKQLTKFIIKPIVSNTVGRVLTLNGTVGLLKANHVTAKKAMEETKPQAINQEGQSKADTGFTRTIKVGKHEYETTITKQTTEFVSSAANKANGNTCGNLNLQEIKDKNGTTVFKTLRQAALTAKPKPEDTKMPGNKENKDLETVRQFCDRVIDGSPNQKDFDDLKQLGLDVRDFTSSKGKVDKKAFSKKVAKQAALLNKALDVAKAAYEANESQPGTVTITSLSLMTPDRPRAGWDGKGGEIGKLADQKEAFRLLSTLSPTELHACGIGDGKTTTFKPLTFNFGVNEGESLGARNQKEMNDEAMQQLLDTTEQSVKDLNTNLQATEPGSKEHTELSVKIRTMHSLMRDISESYQTYADMSSYDLGGSKGWWRADQAYNLTAKISFLTELSGGVNTCNCASGKDRTGMHVQNALNYATTMRERMSDQVEFQQVKQVQQLSPQEKLIFYKSNHFDILEAVSQEFVITEITDFIKLIEQTPEDISAATLAPFLEGGTQALNLSSMDFKGLTTIHSNFKSDPNYQLTDQDKSLISETIIENTLLFGEGGITQLIDQFDEAFSAKFPEPEFSSKTSYEMLTDPNISPEDKAALQEDNRTFMLETGQHDVQEWNTGSPGYKLYSDVVPNRFTGGGQTETYFMDMFGLTEKQVAEQITMQAKYNAT